MHVLDVTVSPLSVPDLPRQWSGTTRTQQPLARDLQNCRLASVAG